MTSDLDEITGKVKQFYEAHPYPGLDEKLMLKGAKRLSRYFDRPGKILYPGCGTGHGVVSMAKIRPDLEAFGVDLSEPSLELAALLAKKHDVVVEFAQANYMKPLPWPFKFQYISLEGTLHHAANPETALKNLVNHLEDDGIVFINLYGKKYHRRKFEIIEALDLLQQGDINLEERYALFKAMQKRLKHKSIKDRVMDASLRVVWHWIYKSHRSIRNRLSNTHAVVAYTEEFPEFNPLWIDAYSNPNEQTFDIWDAKNLLESADLEVVDMLSLGRVNIEDLPEPWIPFFNKLDNWNKRRVMELYYPQTGSLGIVARKRS
jgi:SAM-dependent methyltransferase